MKVVAIVLAMVELTVAVVSLVVVGRARRRGASPSMVMVALAAGAAGSLAMVPVGLLLELIPGVTVNVYGEWLAEAVLGTTVPAALLAVHLLVGWSAVPALLVGFAWASGAVGGVGAGRRVAAGALYGAVMWLVVNSWALPALTGHQSPWARGGLALWPSLTVHVVYGVTVAWVLPARMSPARPVVDPA